MPSRLRSFGFVLGLLFGACGSTKPAATTPSTTAPDAGAPDGSAPACGETTGAPPSAFSVQLADVTGTVTRNGQPWSPTPRVTLRVRDNRPLSDRPLWNATMNGDGSFSARVPHGLYDVQLYDATNLHIFYTVVPGGVQVQGTTHVPVDFQTVVVSGVVRLSGAPFPAEEENRGRVCFAPTGGDSRLCAAVSTGQNATFSLDVPRAYDVYMTWARDGRVPSTTPPGTVPYGSQGLGRRSFDTDTTLDLNVDQPSFVVSGRVTANGGPLPRAASGSSAEIGLGSVSVTIADESVSAFQIRMLSGIYGPIITVPALEVVQSYWQVCFGAGCAVAGDTDWLIDVTTGTPPRGAVEGTIAFQLPQGRTIVPVSGGVGQVRLTLQSIASSAYVIPFHGVQTSYMARVDETFHFRATNLPYGTYSVSFDGPDLPSLPAGVFPLPGTVVVDRDVVTWSGSAPLVPVVFDLKVNGQTMADDTVLDGEPRGVLELSRDTGGPTFTLRLGETGPARFERLMFPGRYQVAVESITYFGRTFLRGYNQDVLPTGRHDLGTVDVAVGAGAPDPVRLDFHLAVHDVSVSVDGANLVTTANSPRAIVRLNNEAGHPFWAEYPPGAESVSVRVYSGCYSAYVVPSMAAHYPTAARLDGEARVGDLCTCDRASTGR